MKTLSELQHEFLNAIQNDKTPEGIHVGSRFRVYSEAYRIRLIESLEEDFPETLSYIHESEKFLEAYIEKYPSTFWTLGEFGVNFPIFVESIHPHLAIQARREWARWVARSVGEPIILPPVSTENEIAIAINPSLQIINGENVEAIYYFKNEIKEIIINLEEEMILKKCLSGKGVSELGVSEDILLPLVTRLTAMGIIVGFKEVK